MHGWDLARATGQPYDAGRGGGAGLPGVRQSFEPPAEGSGDGGLFGPPVAVPDDAPALDRLARRHRPRPALGPARFLTAGDFSAPEPLR